MVWKRELVVLLDDYLSQSQHVLKEELVVGPRSQVLFEPRIYLFVLQTPEGEHLWEQTVSNFRNQVSRLDSWVTCYFGADQGSDITGWCVLFHPW